MDGMIWYAAYGSNLSRDRFRYYITGGRPDGAEWTYPGCRDDSPPSDDHADQLPGTLTFAKHSTTWGGGVAFLDTAGTDDEAKVRLYLVTREQFEDIVAQENHVEPGSVTIADLPDHGEIGVAEGFYPLVAIFGSFDGHIVATVTDAGVEPAKPSTKYLAHVVKGLRDAHDMTGAEIAAYLRSKPGIAGTYSLGELLAVSVEN